MGNKISFQKLTPADDVDLSVYDEAMEYIFSNADVKNVAIAGSYGAGKSSLLETYKKKQQKEFLHISLAHFGEQKRGKVGCADSNVETVLEGKILNQLIQQITPEKIPQTNFRIKRSVSDFKCILIAIIIWIFVLCLLHLIYFPNWVHWVAKLSDSCIKDIFMLFTTYDSMVFTSISAVMIFGIAIFCLLKVQKNKNIFRKFSVQGNEIEIFAEETNSYFDKYLNEVLYLFEKADVDAIVFEDLDRFDDIRIFERLREINMLANIRLKDSRNSRKVLRFFYLIKDDIFINKDRTKFFDYILPIIPVLDSSNSYNQFKRLFVKAGIFEQFDENFLMGLSLYIDDMRILKNIYNEFMIFFNKLNLIDLNPNKMLAMVTYKNIFPRDYNELQLNQGFVYELFKQKGYFVSDELEKCKEKIEDKKERIKNLENERLESIEELEDVKRAKNNRTGTSTQKSAEYNRWVTEVYPLRKKAIEDKLNHQMEALEEELIASQREYQNIENASLCSIVTRENIDKIFGICSWRNEFTDVKESEYFDLLRFLIRNGYIDESYSDYMTFFYDDSLSRRDKVFVRSVTDRRAREYEYKLDNPELVMRNLVISDLEQQETLNFDLFQYLLEECKNKEYINRFMKQIREKRNYTFVAGFFDTYCARTELIKIMSEQWTQFFVRVIEKKGMSAKQIYEYSVELLVYLDDVALNRINIEEGLTKYISEKTDYLAVKGVDVNKIINGFELLNVLFAQIQYEVSNKELFDEVYSRNLYQINLQNIIMMLKVKYQISNVEDNLSQCLSVIFARKEEPLCKYAEANIDAFINVLLIETDVEFNDENDVVVYILNHEDISEEHKIAYINRLLKKVEVLEEIEDSEYQTELIGKNNVVYNAHNIFSYFTRMGLTDNLINFINSNYALLNFSEIKGEQSVIERFRDECIKCENIDDMPCCAIILTVPVKYREFKSVGISEYRMMLLIEEQKIPMTAVNLSFVRQNYPQFVLKYIEENISEYAQIAMGEMASIKEVEEILLWNIEEEIKINLLSAITGTVSVVDKNYPASVTTYILEHNLAEQDIPILYKDYEKYEREIQNSILAIAKKRVAALITNTGVISKYLLFALINDKEISQTNRVDLFIKTLDRCNKSECMLCLEMLDLTEIVKLFMPNRKPKILVNPTNKKVLEYLKRYQFIADYVEDKEKKIFRCTRVKTGKKDLPTELL